MKIGPACDIPPDFKRNTLLYGEPGVGKTVLSATSTRPLIIQTDNNGTISLNNHVEQGLHLIHRAIPANMGEVETLVNQICKGAYPEYETIVLDTVSSLRMFHVMGIEASLDRQMSQNEWTANNKFVRTIMAKLLTKSNRHVIVVAHNAEEKDEKGNIVLIRPDMPNEILQSTKRMFDAIYYYEHAGESGGKQIRTLRLNPTSNKTLTKARIKLKATYTNPTWKQVEEDIDAWLQAKRELINAIPN